MCEGKSFYICLLKVIGLLGLLVLCQWLSLRPRRPSYSIVFISVDQPSNSTGNGTISYNLEMKNPNKESSIYYDDTILSFLYGEQEDEVGQTTIGSYHQETANTRVVSNTVNAKPRPFKLLLNAISNATAELEVALRTRYRYKTWGIKSKFHGLHLKGILPIESNGKLSVLQLNNNSSEITSRKVLREESILTPLFPIKISFADFKDSSPESDICWQLVCAIDELKPVNQQRR
ncbi:unnamed protein product [Sphenostylis stenocarpa]|uniref:Late embryogenesis abundant protein LEA-2 subgroup domain-containing protein n=1 Tax=Sphenostylis stenocarpa TaxID=92480 RepID=A0AA86RVK9_9FABA|nr:unnamed protein product [Sphenostylis stenocarpa]